jgi:hypothetical protein
MSRCAIDHRLRAHTRGDEARYGPVLAETAQRRLIEDDAFVAPYHPQVGGPEIDREIGPP